MFVQSPTFVNLQRLAAVAVPVNLGQHTKHGTVRGTGPIPQKELLIPYKMTMALIICESRPNESVMNAIMNTPLLQFIYG